MSKEAMKLALEALERMTQPVKTNDETQKYKAVTKAITALREALAEQPAQQALDKMAENARALGLDYEPAQQEPVAGKKSHTSADNYGASYETSDRAPFTDGDPSDGY